MHFELKLTIFVYLHNQYNFGQINLSWVLKCVTDDYLIIYSQSIAKIWTIWLQMEFLLFVYILLCFSFDTKVILKMSNFSKMVIYFKLTLGMSHFSVKVNIFK